MLHLDETDLILSTLWAQIDVKDAYLTERCLTDFHRIMYGEDILTFADYNREHRRCLEFIKKALVESKAENKVVVTHHVPSFQLMSPEFRGSQINGALS